MKNNIKASKMQLAKNHSVKAQINDVQKKKVSIEPDHAAVGPSRECWAIIRMVGSRWYPERDNCRNQPLSQVIPPRAVFA
jgi:hypothetical protein